MDLQTPYNIIHLPWSRQTRTSIYTTCFMITCIRSLAKTGNECKKQTYPAWSDMAPVSSKHNIAIWNHKSLYPANVNSKSALQTKLLAYFGCKTMLYTISAMPQHKKKQNACCEYHNWQCSSPSGHGNQTDSTFDHRFHILQGQPVECTKTTVDMKAHVMSHSERTEHDNVVLIAVGKVGSTGTWQTHVCRALVECGVRRHQGDTR